MTYYSCRRRSFVDNEQIAGECNDSKPAHGCKREIDGSYCLKEAQTPVVVCVYINSK